MVYYQANETPFLDPENPPICSPRVRLSDGRYLAYMEKGVPKNKANYKIILFHGFGSSKVMEFRVPQELIDELGIYFLLYDRAGYGESDPNPRRSLKSETFDIQELADQLCLGPKFHVLGISMGSYPTWGCLKYIPERCVSCRPGHQLSLAFSPGKIDNRELRKNNRVLTYWFAKHAPCLLQWWATQKWHPLTTAVEKKPDFLSNRDIESLKNSKGFPMYTKDKLQEQGVFDTLRTDFLACFGDWEFEPIKLSNPFPQNESSVHIWLGYEDKVVPSQLQRCVSQKLPWIKYHEVPDGGHLLLHYDGQWEAITRALALRR